MGFSGHCLCGQVKYTVDAEAPIITGYDHCDDCQRQSGSTYCKLTNPRLFCAAIPRSSSPLSQASFLFFFTYRQGRFTDSS